MDNARELVTIEAGADALRAGTSSNRLRILFASYAPHMPMCHYRLTLQAEALARVGHECFLGSSVMVGADEVIGVLDNHAVVRDLDVVVVQPGVGSEWSDVLDRAKRSRQAFVVDLDDWFWDLPAANGAWKNDNFSDWCDALARILTETDLVTASTPYIAEQLTSWKDAPSVRLLRNPIDLGRWGDPECVTDGPVLGYAGALYGHLEDVQLLNGWLGPFLERHDLRIIHAGDHPSLPSFAEIAGVDPDRVEPRPGQPWNEYASSRPMADMDIGLVPLVARPYNVAKSALKGMEYAACGVPFVASPTPEYRRFGAGLPAGASFEEQSAQDWEAALERLLDPVERLKLSRTQSDQVAQQDIAVRWPEWEAVYLELVTAVRSR